LCLHWFYKIVREKRCVLQWFYKVVRGKCCFYICFKRVVREKPCKTNVTSTFFVDNPPGMVSGERSEKDNIFLKTALASHHRIASRSPTRLRLASPARTHERNETISRLAVSQRTHPPTSNIYIYTHTIVQIYTHVHRLHT